MSKHDLSLPHLVVYACRILVDQRLDSGPFGNISVRIPGAEECWINPSGLTFDQVKPEDIVRIDLNGRIVSGNHKAHPGAFIHREIYRLRNDVQAIVHTHSDNTVAISLLGCEMGAFTLLGASLYGDQGIYDGFTGPVRTSSEGAAIAESLGNKSIVIAKNHGLFVTGQSLEAALWDMIIADNAAKVHLTARQLGILEAKTLSPLFIEKSKLEVRNKQYACMWKSYLHRIMEREPELFANYKCMEVKN